MPKKYFRKKKTVVKKLVKQVKEIKKDLGVPETKLFYQESATPVALTSNTNAMTQALLTDLSVGANGNNRIGDSITIKDLTIKIMYSYQGVSPNFLRFLLVKFNGLYRSLTGGAQANLINNYDVTDARYSNAVSPLNNDYVRMNKKKAGGFKDTSKNEMSVLWDKTITFEPSQLAGASYAYNGKAGMLTKHIKYPHIVKWSGASQSSGHIALIVLNGASTTSGLNPQYGWAVSYGYTDNS